MKSSFDLGKKLNDIAVGAKLQQKALRSGFERNARKACVAMVEAAMEHTPHKGDGKIRGQNMISDSLQKSWVAKYEPAKDKKEIGTVILENKKPYAIYVQKGHKLTKHFVPWLYKDGNVISYETNHNQKLFGLVVGTKTHYVKGVDMVGPAEEAFNKKFDELNAKLTKSIWVKIKSKWFGLFG